jgi:NMD protein affecting ribosome stability and mRNA decay
MVDLLTKFEIGHCKECHIYSYKGKEYSIEKFEKLFIHLIRIHFGLENAIIYKLDADNLYSPVKKTRINIKYQIDDNSKIIKKYFFVKIHFNFCKLCEKIKSGYYEGVFQLRNKQNPSYKILQKEVIEYVKKSKDVGINKIVEDKSGIDFYFTSQKIMQKIGTILYKKYGGELKLSKRLFSKDRQTSKEIYRICLLLRLSEFSPMDVVSFDNKYYLIKSFSKNEIFASDLITHKNRTLRLKEVELILKEAELKSAMVTKRKPHVEVLNPIDFQSTQLENIPLKIGKKVRIAIIDKKLYAVN